MSAKQKDVGSTLTLDQIFLCMQFRLSETFFRKCFKCLLMVLPSIFLIFCNRMDAQKIPKGPPLTFFGTVRRTGDFTKTSKRNSVNFFLHFFSLFRHSATSFRQKILRKGSAFVFLEFYDRMDVEKYRKVPISIFFWNCETFFQFFFHQKVPIFSIFLMICDRRDEKCQSVPMARQSGPTFGFLECFRGEYFDTLKTFCYA